MLATTVATVGTGVASTQFVSARQTATAAGALVSLPPARISDSRTGQQISGPVAPGGTVTVTVTGRGGVPAADVAAAVLTVTAVEPSASGFLTVWPAGSDPTNTSSVNFQAGQSIAGTVITRLGAGGAVQVFNGSPGVVQVIVDVAGYTPAGTPTASGTLMPLTPARIADSRSAVQIGGAIQGLSTADVQVAGWAGVPIGGAAAAVLTVTAISPQAAGFLTVWPAGIGRPTTSSLNFQPGRNIADAVVVPINSLARSGKISIFNGSSGAVHWRWTSPATSWPGRRRQPARLPR